MRDATRGYSGPMTSHGPHILPEIERILRKLNRETVIAGVGLDSIDSEKIQKDSVKIQRPMQRPIQRPIQRPMQRPMQRQLRGNLKSIKRKPIESMGRRVNIMKDTPF